MSEKESLGIVDHW